jgi:hypothetical protein
LYERVDEVSTDISEALINSAVSPDALWKNKVKTVVLTELQIFQRFYNSQVNAWKQNHHLDMDNLFKILF